MSDFHVWSLHPGQKNACLYYRIEVPMYHLSKQQLAQVFVAKEVFTPQSKMAMVHADIVHFYGVHGDMFLQQFKSFRKMKPATRQGQEIYPPAVIYDMDDNTDFVHPFNTSFVKLGTRGYPDARLLKPGDGLEVVDARGNKIWEMLDGVTDYEGEVLDIKRNLHLMKTRHAIIRAAHGATVTSEPLARYYREVIGQPNTYVYPNTIVPGDYDSARAVRTDNSIRILWQGGMSHWIDWYPLRDALKTVCQKHPDVKFVIFGEWFNWIHDVIPDHMVEHHQWVDYPAYKLKRGLLNVDINLCPLAANIFNAGKSAIKWYEASFWDKPEATLAADFGPYKEIVDGETGLLYKTPEEFVEKLSLLIEDAALRRRVATGARRWVLDNRTPEKTLPGLLEFYEETRARQRRELGKPIILQPTLEQIKKATRPMR